MNNDILKILVDEKEIDAATTRLAKEIDREKGEIRKRKKQEQKRKKKKTKNKLPKYINLKEKMKMSEERKYRFETLQLHVGQEQADPVTDARAVPIYATTSYVFKDSAQAAGRFALTEPGNIYTRLMNPTNSVFEERMAKLEGGVGALATASGSAAITYAVQNIATVGDHIVSASNLYGGTHNLFSNTLKEQGLETTFVNSKDPGRSEEHTSELQSL